VRLLRLLLVLWALTACALLAPPVHPWLLCHPGTLRGREVWVCAPFAPPMDRPAPEPTPAGARPRA
jgi:hypothetical protein